MTEPRIQSLYRVKLIESTLPGVVERAHRLGVLDMPARVEFLFPIEAGNTFCGIAEFEGRNVPPQCQGKWKLGSINHKISRISRRGGKIYLTTRLERWDSPIERTSYELEKL